MYLKQYSSFSFQLAIYPIN